ncbi:MAG: SLBB domain-containing protein, partial [Spirochaetota bacterium]
AATAAPATPSPTPSQAETASAPAANPVNPASSPVDPVSLSSTPGDAEKRFFEVVTISGSVRYAGPYARTESLKLSSVVTSDQMLEETSLEYAELTRLKPDGTPEYLTFAPGKVLEGSFDMPLRARDSIRLVAKTGFKGAKALADSDRFAGSVQLTGQVARPEIFAHRSGMTLGNILGQDQILLDTNLGYAEILRQRQDGKNEYLTFRPSEVLDGTKILTLVPRDIVRLYKVGYNPAAPEFDRFGDAVLASGPLQFPGLYAWSPGMKLSALGAQAMPILDTNQVYAEIVRVLPGGKRQTITFAPREVSAGIFDIELQRKDTVRFFSLSEAEARAKVAESLLGTETATAEAGAATAAAGETGAAPGAAAATAAPAAGATAAPAAAAGPAGSAGISSDLGLFLEVVYVTGSARYKGPYARTPSLTLASVVTSDQMLQDTNLDYAELTRRTAEGGWEYQSFSPRKVLSGETDVALRAQDTIRFLPVNYLPEKPDFDRFGNAYALLGATRIPGLYSMDKPLALSSILTADTMLGNTDIYYAEIERWVPGGRNEYYTFSPLAVIYGLYDTRIFPRDLIRLLPAGNRGEGHDFSRYPETVVLKGTVKNQGRYAWYEGMSLSSVLAASDLLIDTDLGYAELRRRTMDKDEIINFSPLALAKGEIDIPLMPRDVVIFYPKYNKAPVTVAGEVEAPKVIPYFEGIELSSVLRSVKLSSPFEALKASITRTSGEVSEVYLETYLRKQSAAKVTLSPGDVVSLKKLLPDEYLPVVTVRGAVHAPQSVEFKDGMRLADALSSAGGYDPRAYPFGIVLIRKTAADMQQKQVDRLIAQLEAVTVASAALPTSSDTALSSSAAVIANLQIDAAMQRAKLGQLKQLYKEGFGRISLDIPETLEALASSSANVLLERDDLIFVPSTPTYVLVSGEIADQNIVAYQPGMKVRDAITQSGWLTRESDLPNAYILRASGRLESTNKKGFLWFRPNILNYSLNPGDTVYIPAKATKVSVGWAYAKDSFSLLGTILTGALTTKTLLGL